MNRFVLGAWAAILLVASGSLAPAQETIKIGGIFSLSGPAAPFGVPERDIVEILANNLNEKGGVNGKKIEMVFYDDQTNPTESARGANKLIRQDGVVAIIGSTIGTGTLALMPVAMASQIPVLAPVSTISVTSKDHAFWPWVFRIAPTTRATARARSKYASAFTVSGCGDLSAISPAMR